MQLYVFQPELNAEYKRITIESMCELGVAGAGRIIGMRPTADHAW